MSATQQAVTLSIPEQLLAIEEIKRVFAGRLRCMDNKEWDRYASFHTDDVVSDSWASTDAAPQADGTAAGSVTGGRALADAIRGTLDGPVKVVSVHHGHTPEIELTSDTTARGVWAMEDKLWWTNAATDAEEHLHGYGHYHEEYRNVEGRWLISYRNLTRLRVDATDGFHNR
ncbi:nuclear transport factor 2 family protein [Tomitella biformata]|uniref:nuclear transport factor 2 family protein n=1 Tax=Tomitella biformata TaxID=630403 RepID=UPI0004638A61|nr:nuclear transport factor 2 family protein [Tomitella biformata]